jgi:hypothetical protein
MSAMRLVIAAREVKLHLAVANVFKHPTLSELVHTINTLDGGDAEHFPPFALAPTGDDLGTLLEQVPQLCQTHSNRVQDIYTCTPLQQHYIELSTSSPSTTTLQIVYTISSSVDVSRLR